MSIFDDTPLEIGIKYYDKTIIGWDAEDQKYLVSCSSYKKDLWLSREKVERDYGSSLLDYYILLKTRHIHLEGLLGLQVITLKHFWLIFLIYRSLSWECNISC